LSTFSSLYSPHWHFYYKTRAIIVGLYTGSIVMLQSTTFVSLLVTCHQTLMIQRIGIVSCLRRRETRVD